MSGGVLVIGIGNAFRCDDGVGPAVADAIAGRHIPGVQVMTDIGDPGSILDAWTGVDLAIVVDAAVSQPGTPGRVRRWTPADGSRPGLVSSHMLGLAQAYSLGQALARLPSRLVVFTVDVADVGHGDTLTPVVAGAVPCVVGAVEAELASTESA
ncbi:MULTISPECIES: hydrogenase maturation protease [unclassified Mycolicibacterium]|uniref:hydrogenase maturation protease n=1 Tax=unclassified Mycolicibacterium TaxID=2636767 RepID=UPI002ED908EA